MVYDSFVIKTSHTKTSQSLWNGRCPKEFVPFRAVAERKLQMLDSAIIVADLSVPPGNRLEALKGDRKNSWSIRINDKWRVCFRFEDGDAFDVEIVDYH